MKKSTPPKGYRVEQVASLGDAKLFGAYLELKSAIPGVQHGVLQTVTMEDTRAKAVVACWEHQAMMKRSAK
jgi:hypothetical protein